MPKVLLSIIALLSAAAICSAQENAGSTAANLNAKPKVDTSGFYMEASYGCMKTGNDLFKNFTGGSLILGARFARHHKIQFELGAYQSNSNNTTDTEDPYTVDVITSRLYAVPVLLSYSYCIPLDAANRFEIRISPVAGLFAGVARLTDNYYEVVNGQQVSQGDSEDSFALGTSFAWGAGVGVTYHFTRHFYIDAGYRFLRAGKTTYDFGENDDGTSDVSTLDALKTHWFSLSLGVQF